MITSLARLASDLRSWLQQLLDRQGVNLETDLPFLDTKQFSSDDAGKRQQQLLQWISVTLQVEQIAAAGLYAIDEVRIDDSTIGDSADGQLRILPSTLVLRGSFRSFVTLLEGLRRNGAGLMVRGVSIQPVEKAESGDPDNLFTIKLSTALAVQRYESYGWVLRPSGNRAAPKAFTSDIDQVGRDMDRRGARGAWR